MCKYKGPFPVLKHIGKVSYKLELPAKLKIFLVFHVSMLKAYHGDEGDLSRSESKRAPTTVVISFDKEVEYILTDRLIHRRGVPNYREYLVKWKNLTEGRDNMLVLFNCYIYRDASL